MNNLRKNHKRKARVTIIVGIIAESGIVFTSDSQTSYSPGSSNRRDTEKICELKFRSGQAILVAQSGDENAGSRMLEIYKDLLASDDFDDRRKPVDIAEKAAKQLKSQMADLNGWAFGDEASVAYWEEAEASFLIGYYFNQEPHLYILNLWPGYGVLQNRRYITLGCGGTVGEFILQRIISHPVELDYATVAGIYTVEQVKKVDSFCGGPTTFGILFKDGGSVVTDHGVASTERLKKTLEMIARQDEQINKEWKKVFGALLKEVLLGERKDQKGNLGNE